MTKQSEVDPKLQARVKALKKRAKIMAQVKEAPFIRVLEDWLTAAHQGGSKKGS